MGAAFSKEYHVPGVGHDGLHDLRDLSLTVIL